MHKSPQSISQRRNFSTTLLRQRRKNVTQVSSEFQSHFQTIEYRSLQKKTSDKSRDCRLNFHLRTIL